MSRKFFTSVLFAMMLVGFGKAQNADAADKHGDKYSVKQSTSTVRTQGQTPPARVNQAPPRPVQNKPAASQAQRPAQNTSAVQRVIDKMSEEVEKRFKSKTVRGASEMGVRG